MFFLLLIVYVIWVFYPNTKCHRFGFTAHAIFDENIDKDITMSINFGIMPTILSIITNKTMLGPYKLELNWTWDSRELLRALNKWGLQQTYIFNLVTPPRKRIIQQNSVIYSNLKFMLILDINYTFQVIKSSK